MVQINGFPGLRGVPELDFEVTVVIKNKKTGGETRQFYPNVGAVKADHQLTAECAGLEVWAAGGMPQTLFLLVGFNASATTGNTLEVSKKLGGAVEEGERKDG